MNIKIQVTWRPETGKYKDFEIGIACENIIPPMPKAGIDIGVKSLISESYNYACKISFIYNIQKEDYIIGDKEITFAKGVLKSFHEHHGTAIEEAIKKAGKEALEWIDKSNKNMTDKQTK